MHWFSSGMQQGLTQEEEVVGLAVVLSLEERAKKGMLMNSLGDANGLAMLAGGYGIG